MKGEIMEEKVDEIKEIIEAEKASKQKTAIVNVARLNVRKHSNKESRILTVIHKDGVFPVLETSAEWLKIQVGDIVGWCRKEFTR